MTRQISAIKSVNRHLAHVSVQLIITKTLPPQGACVVTGTVKVSETSGPHAQLLYVEVSEDPNASAAPVVPLTIRYITRPQL